MIRLGVNVDHVATIREARGTVYPDPLAAAVEAVKGGADQITIHLREDRRHIRDDDVRRMRRDLKAPLNLEMSIAAEIVEVATQLKPDTATLVPERRQELTTEGGLDLLVHRAALQQVVAQLQEAKIQVSLFIDPVETQIRAASELNVHVIELHTGTYCDAKDEAVRLRELERLVTVARLAKRLGITVAAGHGIHYENASGLARALPEVSEYNIGHAIVARAIFTGMERAVRDMKALLTGVQ